MRTWSTGSPAFPRALPARAGFSRGRWRWALGLGLVAAAAALQLALWPWIAPNHFHLFYPAIIASAWLGGSSAGLVASAASALLVDFLFMEPRFALALRGPDLVQLGIFLLIGGLISSLHLFFSRSLQRTEMSLRALSESIPHLVWSASPGGEVDYGNSHALEYLGARGAAELSRRWLAAIHPDDREGVIARWDEARRTGEPFRVECRLQRASGPHRWHLVQAYPFRRQGGPIRCWFLTATDVEDERQARDALRAAAEELTVSRARLQLANAELDAFSYSVSHDLRAPLRSMDGFSQALLRHYGGELDGRGRDYLDRISRAAVRMGRLIDDLLRLSRISRARLSPQPVDLGAHAASIVAALARAEPEREVEIEIEQPLLVRADPELLDVALENLLGNAWKYTSHHSRARITVGARAEGGRRVYYVRDDGAGFDMQYADKLFGSFQRLHGADEFPGTGIGLATVKRIIGRHGGEIWAQGAVEQGATFSFTLGDEHEP